jgi:hypothetical protein
MHVPSVFLLLTTGSPDEFRTTATTLLTRMVAFIINFLAVNLSHHAILIPKFADNQAPLIEKA